MSEKQLCLKRLMKEYHNLQMSPVEGCSAAPLEDNLLEWHANITTPRFQGIAFHLILEFPENYPKMPPKVRPCHYIKHNNVFDDYICLDILTMAAETATTPYRGWSNAYTVSSLLVQLQCFLFDVERVEEEEERTTRCDDYGIDRMYREARNYRCNACTHQGCKPWPQLDDSSNLNAPGFYKTLRPAVVRAGADLSTAKLGEVPEGEIIRAVKFDQHRACIILNEDFHNTSGTDVAKGWCSVATKNGVLLKRFYTSGPGVYKVNRKCEVAIGDEIVGEIPRAKSVDILKVFELNGKDLCGLVDLKHKSVTLTKKRPQGQYGEVYLKNMRFLNKPSALKNMLQVAEVDEEEVHDDGSRLFVDDSNILDILFTFCDPDTLHRICMVNPYFAKRIDQHKMLNELNNRCYYTLKTMGEENTVLGVGLESKFMDKVSRATRARRYCLQQLHPTFDLLSAEAFYKHGCRTTVYKDSTFDSFLPLYINHAHGKRALPVARKAIDELWKKENKSNRVGPKSVLNTLIKLMNTTVIDMMKTVQDLAVAEIQLYDSIKALEGYMGFHHLLLAFAEEDPRIVRLAEERIGHFLSKAACRDKEVTPDIGELIVCLALSKYKWEEFIPKYIDECFQRNARWILAEYPNLRNLEPMGTMSCVRLRQSYDASKTSFRMAMFQRYFMKEIANPALIEDHPDKLKILFEEYNGRFGKPVKGLAEALQRHSRKVLACDNYFDFFELVGFCAPTGIGLCDWLRSSVKRSEKRQYHRESNILRYRDKYKVKPNYSLHLKQENCMCCAGQVFQLNRGGKPTLISEKKTQLDLAFVVDCTGSMYKWLAVAKQQMKKIVTQVSKKTQFKRVRFAVVGYRDFGYEMGDWREATLVKPFTDKVQTVQQYVQALEVGGGGDMEALSAGLAKAAGLTWDKNAMKIIIHIGDQVPHGMGGQYDSFPDGDPDGSDALRTAHVLAKKGVVIYNVDCSSSYSYSYYNTSTTALRSTFYHALSVMTNGTCVNITDAGALSQIVLGAALEEQAQNKLAKLILPHYQEVLKRHEIGRFEQHVHQIYHKLKAAKVKVHTSMGVTDYPEYAEHQIECITYCTDLKQAKAMANSEYFMDFKTTVNFSAAHTAPITEGQVRTCLKRIKDKAAEILFHQQGCAYRTKKWQDEAFDERWSQYQVQGARKKLKEPWNAVRNDELNRLHRVLKEAGKIASGELKLKSASSQVRGRKNPIKTSTRGGWGQKKPAQAGARQQPGWGPRHRQATPQKRTAPAPTQQQRPQQPQAAVQQQAPVQRSMQRPQQQRPQQQAPVAPAQRSQQPVQRPMQRPQQQRPQQQAPATPAQRPQQPVQRPQVAVSQPQRPTRWGPQPASQRQAGAPQQQAPRQQQNQRRSPGLKRQAPTPPRQQQPTQRQSPGAQRTSPGQGNKDYLAPHRRSGSITRTSTYMGAHGPQSIRGSRSLSRDPVQGQQTRSTSRDSHRRRPTGAVARERPMTMPMPAQPMARNQSIPINNQSVYQHQPVTQQQYRPAPVQQAAPVNPVSTVFITNLPPTMSKSQFEACLQHYRVPKPTAMGKDRQNNLIWCTFAHPQYAALALNANMWVQGVKLNITRPQNAI
jgi:ubiquitin-protein ligase/Mg-chelatase subunit ChlD